MVIAAWHLRRALDGMRLSHYVNNRTLKTLCGVDAIDWPLDAEPKHTPDCEKCLKLLDTVKAET